jgi:hypothetical protein
MVPKIKSWQGKRSAHKALVKHRASSAAGSGETHTKCDHTIEPPLIYQPAEGVTVLLSRRSKRLAAPEGDPEGIPANPRDPKLGQPPKQEGALVTSYVDHVWVTPLGFVQKVWHTASEGRAAGRGCVFQKLLNNECALMSSPSTRRPSSEGILIAKVQSPVVFGRNNQDTRGTKRLVVEERKVMTLRVCAKYFNSAN